MTYDETLHVLASWAGRPVVVAVRPAAADWYLVNMAGRLPQRKSAAVEGAEDLEGESYSYSFSESGPATCFFLSRDQFVTATLDDEQLSIEVTGAMLDIIPQRR